MAEALIAELETRFPTNHIMHFFGIIFPEYWLQDNVDMSFSLHLAILKATFYQPKLVVDAIGDGTWVSSLLSASALNEQMAMFKMAMKSNSKPVLQPPFTVNAMTKLW